MLIDFRQFLNDSVEKVGSSCEKVTDSNVINVLKGGSVGLCPSGAKAFLLVTDNMVTARFSILRNQTAQEI